MEYDPLAAIKHTHFRDKEDAYAASLEQATLPSLMVEDNYYAPRGFLNRNDIGHRCVVRFYISANRQLALNTEGIVYDNEAPFFINIKQLYISTCQLHRVNPENTSMWDDLYRCIHILGYKPGQYLRFDDFLHARSNARSTVVG